MPSQPALRARSSVKTFLPPLLVFVLAAAAYIATLAPGVLGGDAGELQFVPYILSLTHPTGYPLQTLLDRLWVTIVPLGSVAWRTNLLSAVTAAAGIAVAWALIRRASGSWLAASGACLLLAVTPVYWGQAVLGDKYALNGLLTALLLSVAYEFYRHPESPASWAWLGFVTGLALAHHRSFLAFGPALAVLVLARGWRAPEKAKALLAAAVCLVLPLVLYLYVPFASHRGLPPYQPPIDTLREFSAYVLDAGYLGQVGLLPRANNVVAYAQTALANFGWLAMALGVAGVVVALAQRRQPGWLVFLLAGFLLQVYLTQNYAVPRQFVFYIPAYVCLAVLFGTAIGLLSTGSSETAERAPAWRGPVLMLPALLLLAAGLARVPPQWRTQQMEQAAETPLDLFRQDLKTGGQADRLAASLRLAPSGALISADWEQATPLWYEQQVAGACPDCLIRQGLAEDLDVHALEAGRDARPLLVARTVNGAGEWSEPTAAGALVALEGRPNHTLPPALVGVDATFDERVRLAGYRWPLGAAEARPGKVLPLSLAWQLVAPSPDYAISLRLMRGDETIWKADASAPVLGMQPFSKLEPGQVVGDYYEIPIPPDAPAGRYTLDIILYLSHDGAFTNAEAVSGTGERLGSQVQVMSFDLH
ncbi:MAG: protein O-mannosyl-transferase family [Nitrososphaerales archaeon]